MASASAHHAPLSRHPQEINVENEKVDLVNPLIEPTFARIEELGSAHGREGELALWESVLFEARALLAKLVVLLENHSINGQPFLPAALAWAILRAKVPEKSTIRVGWFELEGGAGVPHFYIETQQPAALMPTLAALYTPEHPRAKPTLTTDLSSYPKPHLTDALILGQMLKLNKDPRKSAPYPQHPRVPYSQDNLTRFHPSAEERMKISNLVYVAEHPEMYLRWAVSTEMRKFVYPIVISMLNSDPTKLEYIRITDEEVQRILSVQKEQATRTQGDKQT
jgi:hypothetical protein